MTSLCRSVEQESPAEDYKREHAWPSSMKEDLPGMVLVHNTSQGFFGGRDDAETSWRKGKDESEVQPQTQKDASA